MSAPSLVVLTEIIERQFLALAKMQAANLASGGLASTENANISVTCALLSSSLNLWCEAACKAGKVTFAEAQQQVLNALDQIAKEAAADRRSNGLPVDQVLQ